MNKETDRELLELAAKAAGHTVVRWTDDGTALLLEGVEKPWNSLHPNPHSDCMGDALRLAVALRLHIKPGKYLGDGCTVEAQRNGIAGCTAFYGDKDKQMCRAITIAASEIGRAMKGKQ